MYNNSNTPAINFLLRNFTILYYFYIPQLQTDKSRYIYTYRLIPNSNRKFYAIPKWKKVTIGEQVRFACSVLCGIIEP